MSRPPVTERLYGSGCHRVVDAARPAQVSFEVTGDQTLDACPRVTLTIGPMIVHRCQLGADGESR
jgi:hypothetical protein